MYRITVHYHVDGSRPGHPARSSEEPGQRVQREGRSTSTSARVVDELAGRGFAASRHACVLEATMCDPQVTTPAPSYDPGSHSKKSRRHGQPAPAVPSRTAARAPARTRQQPQPAPTRTGPHFHAARPSPDEIATMVIAVPFVVKGWHAPAGRRTREPRPLPRPGRSDRQRRRVPGTGTRRQAGNRTTSTASARSQVRPGPRLRRYAQTAAKPRKQDSCRSFSDPPCRYARAFKLIEAAQARWCAVNAPHLVALVRAGATFVDGQLAERPTQTAA